MNRMNVFVFVTTALCLAGIAGAQSGVPTPPPDREAIVKAAKHVMEQARYCALITVDEDGQPHARTIDAFPAEDNFVVWMATNPATRKVAHIKRNPRVTLYYFDPKDPGYVTLLGRAEIVDSPAEKSKRWKEEWSTFYADKNRGSDYVLIRVTPYQLEAVSYGLKVLNDPKTWAVPTVSLR
jgi:general stress protein 26